MATMTLQGKKEGNVTVVNIGGKIDEDADFSSCAIDQAITLTVDFSQVQTINSCGIREYIKWIKTAPTTASIIYRNCPKVIVDQINMVDGFLPGNGTVDSFFVPYYNEDSGSEKNVLFMKGKDFNPGKVTPPAEVKDDGGNAMEIDVIEAKYFKFVEKLRA